MRKKLKDLDIMLNQNKTNNGSILESKVLNLEFTSIAHFTVQLWPNALFSVSL